MKYAIVMTADYSLLPGVNGMLNALKYYNSEVEFHLLYWDGSDFAEYIQSVQDTNLFPNFHPIPLQAYVGDEMATKGPNGKRLRSVYYLKFWRHIYPARELQDYDAVCIMDADMFICNNFDKYFEIAAKTGRIMIPNNSRSKCQFDWYRTQLYLQACNPPLHSMPLFFKPSVHSKILSTIPKTALNIGRSEMPSIHYVFHRENLMDKVVVLPNCLWLQTCFWQAKLAMKEVNSKRFLVVCGDDRINTIHGRWWLQRSLDRYYRSGDKGFRYANVALFLDFLKFYNTELFYKIAWQWGELPQ